MAAAPPVMAGGDGPASYDQNSAPQGDAFTGLGGPLLRKSLAQLRLPKEGVASTFPVCIADLGSSTGKNAVAQMGQVINWLTSSNSQGNLDGSQQVLAFFSDLPDNDWASLLKRIHVAKGEGALGAGCLVAAAPGSFYERLFPDHCLHIVTSNFALQWLSR
jgi:hypothetical protein